MDKDVIKNIIITCLLLGLILGVLAVIPVVGIVILFVMVLLSAPITLVFLIMDGKLDITNAKDGIIYGAICGYSANLAFSAAYSIVTALLSVIFNYSSNLFLSAIIVNSPLWLLIICILFLGFLPAVTNALGGFATYYIIEFIREMYERKTNK